MKALFIWLQKQGRFFQCDDIRYRGCCVRFSNAGNVQKEIWGEGRSINLKDLFDAIVEEINISETKRATGNCALGVRMDDVFEKFGIN